MAHEVFISYAREDTAVATAVVETLSKWGVRCWIDRETIAHAHGSEWSREIVAAITQSKAVVLVLSQSANRSSFVASEAHIAFDRGIPILPFRIEDVPPGDSLALYLSRVQWLDAFPIFETHLETLADRTTRLIDRQGGAPGGSSRRGIGLGRLVSGYAAHLTGRGRSWLGGRSTRESVPTARVEPARESASEEDPATLAKEARWWRLHTLIDGCERAGRPLRRLEPWRETVAAKLAEFDAAFTALSDRLQSTSPSRLGPDLERLRQIVPDHPRLETLQARVDERDTSLQALRQEVGELRREERWLAIENAMRRFLLTHRQHSTSLVDAADEVCSNAKPEARRLLLLIWTLLAPSLVLLATWLALRIVGVLDDSFLARLPESGAMRTIGPPMISALLQLAATTAALSLLLTFLRRSAAAGFAGAAVVAIAAAVLLQAAPWATASFLAPSGGLVEWQEMLVGVVPNVALVLSMATILQSASCRLLGLDWMMPSASMLLACLAAALLLPSTADSPPVLRPEWLVWLPSAAIFAGLLAAAGLLEGWLRWWMVLVVPSAIGAFAAGSWSGNDPLGWPSIAAAAIVLFVAGCLASPRHSLRGYLAIALLSAVAALVGGAWTDLDRGSAEGVSVRLAALLAIWGIACSEVAISHEDVLSRRVAIMDGATKFVLLLRGIGTPFTGGWLTETDWFVKASRTRPAARPSPRRSAAS